MTSIPTRCFAALGDVAGGLDRDEQTSLLNAVLHHPDFQGLEACWRGLDWMLKRTSRCEQVEFRLLDLSFDELVADVSAMDELEGTGLYQIFVDKPASRGDLDPWSLFIGNYLFDLSSDHAGVLGRISKIARQSSAPFLAGVNPLVLDRSFKLGSDDSEAWQALRALPEATVLGLATPRFLLRLPYGANTQSIDAFEYEECDGRHDWKEYLWANTAYACAVMLARGLTRMAGPSSRHRSSISNDMPLHATVDADGDPRPVTAEAWLVRERIQWLTSVGLMPLLCVKGRDSLQLALIQSLAMPRGAATSPLLGRWGQKDVVRLPRTGMKWPVSVSVGMMAGQASGRITGELSDAADIPVAAPVAAGEGEGDGTSDSSSEFGSDGSSGSDDFTFGDSSSSDDSSSSSDFSSDDSSSSEDSSSSTDFNFGDTSSSDDSSSSDTFGSSSSDDSSSTDPFGSISPETEMDPDLAALLGQSESSSEETQTEGESNP